MNLVIGINNASLSSYNSYLIALLSITIPIFISLFISGASLWLITLFICINAIIVYFLVRKISTLNYSNNQLVEAFNGIQSKRTGSRMFILDQTSEVVNGESAWSISQVVGDLKSILTK